MTISLEQFKNNTLGGSYGNPGTNTYVGQCVSYVRQYMEQVLGIKTAVWGNAADYWTNPAVLQYFDRITDGSRQDGDVLVWGDDAGNWTGPEGHIAISYGGKLLNQNYGGSLRVSINSFFAPGYLGALRPKGGKTMDFDDGVALYRSVLHREPENSQAAQNNVGLKPSSAMDNMRGSEEWLTQNHILLVAYPDAVKAIGALNQQLASMSSRPGKEEIAALQSQLTDANVKAQKALAEYEDAKAQADKLQAQADTDKAAGDSFLRRLGQFISQFLPGSNK